MIGRNLFISYQDNTNFQGNYPNSKIHGANMGPIWVPPGAGRTQLGPMLATWTLLSGYWPYWSLWWLDRWWPLSAWQDHVFNLVTTDTMSMQSINIQFRLSGEMSSMEKQFNYNADDFDSLVQDCCISIAYTVKIVQSCIRPFICHYSAMEISNWHFQLTIKSYASNKARWSSGQTK